MYNEDILVFMRNTLYLDEKCIRMVQEEENLNVMTDFVDFDGSFLFKVTLKTRRIVPTHL